MTTNGNSGSGESYLLSEALLERCRERAPGYDSENRFFFEDFDELKEAGYTKINIPTEFGGHGKSLAEVCHEQRRLAMYAPATALAINMHLYWCGVAGDLLKHGDDSLAWMLEEASKDKIFAAGIEGVGARLFEVNGKGKDVTVEEIWNVRHMKNHFSSSIYHLSLIHI